MSDQQSARVDVDVQKLGKLLLKEFNKDDGKGKLAWCLATDPDSPTIVKEWISTGSRLLDTIIANRPDGGVPVGKLTEISGEEASGKTLICSHIVANTQRKGGLGVYIDTENAVHPEFMAQLGVDIGELVYLQPGTIEETGEAIEKVIRLTRARAPDRLVTIIWDSVAGTPPQAEIEGTFDPNDRMGVTAKALSKMMRKLTQVWGKERICMVFTNQLRTKLGVSYGDPMMTPGGKAIPYHASVRVRLTRRGNQADPKSKSVYGVETTAKVVKNRLGPPLRKCEFNISFSRGVEDVESWRDYLHSIGEIEKADGWCYLTSFPSGKIEEKGVKQGTDRGIKFREKGWEDLVTLNDALRSHVISLLDKNLIIKYGARPADQELDPESLMEAEEVAGQ